VSGAEDPYGERDPISLTLEVLGSRAGFLVMREAFHGVRRFDDLQRSLGITAASLSARLKALVSDGLLEQVPYREPGARTRHEYRLSRKGEALLPVLVAMREWGNEHLLDGEAPVHFTHARCGAAVGAEVRCRRGHRVALGELRETGSIRP
jgi:DNA-binding HxlR family transcriptional regulator